MKQYVALSALLSLVTCAHPGALAVKTISLVNAQPGVIDATTRARWKPVVGHTHNIRAKELGFEEAKLELVKWCKTMGIAAMGVGSPWEPDSAAAYERYEGPDRNLYYSGQIDPSTLMFRESVGNLFSDLNRLSSGDTFFYQDNESPKSHMGHAWWFGYQYDVPSWHDYSQDKRVQYWKSDLGAEINPLTGKPHRRRSLLEIVAMQRKAGAVAVFAHPTSWWVQDGKFITNIAAQSALFLNADGYLDGLVVMGYQARKRGYQNLWFHLLDTGAIVPGFAEVDSALDRKATYSGDRTFMNYMDLRGAPTVPSIVGAAKRGASFVSTGAIVSIEVDGVAMGKIASTRVGQTHRLHIEAYPHPSQQHFSRIEILGKGGKVLATQDKFPGGILEYDLAGRDEPHYVVVRAFGQDDQPDLEGDPHIKHMAMTNPVYLHPAGWRFEAQQTDVTLVVPARSRWTGGTIELQKADGTVLQSRTVVEGTMRATLPASARILVSKPGMDAEYFYIAMENPEVQRLLTYLTEGEFRKDYPDVGPGEVPSAAFHVRAMRTALMLSRHVLE